MIDGEALSPAHTAAREADGRVIEALKERKNFCLEAGAGAGKTYSLIEVLRHLIAHDGVALRRNSHRIACITYTNAATAVINSRIDGNSLVFIDTIHAFCWSLIKGFQPNLRQVIASMEVWRERLEEVGGIASRRISYDLGYRRVTDEVISLHHDDVLALMIALLPFEKFQAILAAKYPFILIDEYQDTDANVMEAIKAHLLGRKGGPLIGLFGDHWQRIYENTCGRVTHVALEEIGKGANFRSATAIVRVLNAMRPELPQEVKDKAFIGSAGIFHTNAWPGKRRTGAGGGHWKDDLPADVAHRYLRALIARLESEGWEFAPEKTKILMLTHNVLAMEQGYSNLRNVFRFTDDYIKKQDEYIAFLADKIEPACDAYGRKRYGEMFAVLGGAASSPGSHANKVGWTTAMEGLLALRETGTIGDVIDYIRASPHLRLPDGVLSRELESAHCTEDSDEMVPDSVKRLRRLRQVAYQELIALDRFVDGFTPFATKHSVKGDEYENVLVVVGRGWNQYNFGQFLEWASARQEQKANVEDYERNRNLFYVSCSRPTTRLALLFTQLLSEPALNILRSWFGSEAVQEFIPQTEELAA